MRIPLTFGPATPGDALLIEGDAPAPPGHYTARFTLPPPAFGHIPGCTCCTPRGPAATALATLFRARATGTAPFFTRVTVTASPAGQAAIRAAVQDDVLAAARFAVEG